jgi:hypothetical protein
MSDIVRRKESITQDFEKKTLNGFIGIFIHIIVLGFVNLLLMGLIGVKYTCPCWTRVFGYNIDRTSLANILE